jgi:hypothetical protein
MVVVSSMAAVLWPNRKQHNCNCRARLGALNYVILDDPKLQETQERANSRGESVYHMANAIGCDVADLTELNTQRGLSCDLFMMLMEEATNPKQNKNTDPLRAHLLKRQTATKKLQEEKYMTAGLHD